MATATVSITMLYRSSIGKKIIMAVTGLVWIGYVVMHMYGNLKIFTGQDHFIEYAEGLRNIGAPVFGHLHLLTIARIGLIAAMVLHVWAAVTLYQQARKARPVGYTEKAILRANYASLTVRYGGVIIFLFLIYHLAHLTWGWTGTPFVRGDPYFNVVSSFQSPILVVIYLIAVTALSFHLYHGTWSMLQTLGIVRTSIERPVRLAALALALIVTLGFASVPIAVLMGFVTL